ncbi:5547_t:CDS:2 [Funneliformis caledonium]|uniref:5547_t:CDS:1 n=2 Tax=Funneliformis TaxID=1117308 RepID=A0A9N9E0E7_9GLOM|nr:16668_t:CDS:2 [Funneliformis mosseae]CAG8653937.1 5547_t:CDS:2 [Funneliformis caledonium]
MKFSTVAFLIVALLASIAYSAPMQRSYYDDFYETCKESSFKRPVDGIIYNINSTQVADFVMAKGCVAKYAKGSALTVDIFSIGVGKCVDTIAEQEMFDHEPTVYNYLIDKVWANNDAKYFLIGTLYHKHYSIEFKSGVFTAIDPKEKSEYY